VDSGGDGRRRRTCVSTDAPMAHAPLGERKGVRSTPSLDDGVERQVAHSYHPLTLRICAFPWELERLHTSPLDTSMTFQGPPLQVWLPPRRSRPKSRGRPPSRLSSRLSRRLVSTLTQLTLVCSRCGFMSPHGHCLWARDCLWRHDQVAFFCSRASVASNSTKFW